MRGKDSESATGFVNNICMLLYTYSLPTSIANISKNSLNTVVLSVLSFDQYWCQMWILSIWRPWSSVLQSRLISARLFLHFFPPFYFVFLFSLSSDDTLKVKMANTKYQSLIFIINCVCVLKMWEPLISACECISLFNFPCSYTDHISDYT